MITFPRAWPTEYSIKSQGFGLNVLQSSFEAESSRQPLFQNFNAGLTDRWEGLWTVRRFNGINLGGLSAFLTSLNGRQGTFLAFDADRKVPNGNISVGTGDLTCDSTLATCDSTLITCDEGVGLISINGGGQVGSSVNVIMDAVSDALLPGDYIQIGAGYHMVLEATDGGTTSLNFAPPMRSSPVDGQGVIFINPVMVARLTAQFKDWQTDMNKIGEFSFAFEEVI